MEGGPGRQFDREAPGQMAQPSVDGNLKNRLSLSKIGGGGGRRLLPLRPLNPPLYCRLIYRELRRSHHVIAVNVAGKHY